MQLISIGAVLFPTFAADMSLIPQEDWLVAEFGSASRAACTTITAGELTSNWDRARKPFVVIVSMS